VTETRRTDRDGRLAGEGYDQSAGEYDDLLLHNREGARRLVGAIPEGRYDRILDVGCGTGFVTEAMVERFGTRHVTGVDPSEGMLARFREKLAGRVDATLIVAGVHDMDVPNAAFDAVVSGMAFHWFPDQPAAIRAMARRVRAGGILAILASGRGSDRELLDVMEGIEPPVPRAWTEVFDRIQRTADEVAGWMRDAGLDVVDAWEERRVRRAPADAYLARIGATSSHVSAEIDPAELAGHVERLVAAVHDASGPGGFRYTFVKLFAIGRRPA
jgi:ubiquinone/menaquinone biosynthesis C-methylase UbiE